MLLTAALACLIALPLFAQRPGRGGGFAEFRSSPTFLVTNKSVQEEIKLDDKQKEAVKEVSSKMFGGFGRGGGKGKVDREAAKAAREEGQKALTKLIDELKPEQKKRLNQIAIQQSGVKAFEKDEVATALKLTDDQKKEIKEIAEETTKDLAEIAKDGFTKDEEKRKENREKVAKLTKEAIEKATKNFTSEQKSTWKDLNGEPFEVKIDFGGFGGGKGKRGGKKKDV